MKRTYYNTSKQANAFDKKTAQFVSQIHASVRNLYAHLADDVGYIIPSDDIESFERWHEEVEVRMGMRPTGDYGHEVLKNTERYTLLTVPEYMRGMTFQVNQLSRHINQRNKRHEQV